MDWTDEGMIVSFRNHGESSAIIDVLTLEHGLHSGLVRGGASRKLKPQLQPGEHVKLEWRARLQEQLGTFKVDPIKTRTLVLSDRLRLAGLTAICALIKQAFPERMHLPSITNATLELADLIGEGSDWIYDYALWEMQLLDDLGYGLDFTQCAATGAQQNLIYVSPKSGRAVSAEAGETWKDHLLPLPSFHLEEKERASAREILSSLKLTGFFLEKRLAPSFFQQKLPDARARLIKRIQKELNPEG